MPVLGGTNTPGMLERTLERAASLYFGAGTTRQGEQTLPTPWRLVLPGPIRDYSWAGPAGPVGPPAPPDATALSVLRVLRVPPALRRSRQGFRASPGVPGPAGPRGLMPSAPGWCWRRRSAAASTAPGSTARSFRPRRSTSRCNHIVAPREITTAWFTVVDNFRQLELFQTIKVEPVSIANGGSEVRLTFHPNEEPCHVIIQIYAEGE